MGGWGDGGMGRQEEDLEQICSGSILLPGCSQSLMPNPQSQLPTPNSQLPTPNSQFPTLHL